MTYGTDLSVSNVTWATECREITFTHSVPFSRNMSVENVSLQNTNNHVFDYFHFNWIYIQLFKTTRPNSIYFDFSSWMSCQTKFSLMKQKPKKGNASPISVVFLQHFMVPRLTNATIRGNVGTKGAKYCVVLCLWWKFRPALLPCHHSRITLEPTSASSLFLFDSKIFQSNIFGPYEF